MSFSKCQLVFMTSFSPHAQNLELYKSVNKCLSQQIGCYNLFGPIFYLQDSKRKQIEQLLLLCSILGNRCSSLYYTIQTRSRSNTKYLINIHKYFGASYELKPTRTIFSQCAQKKFFDKIFRGQIMIKTNIMPILNIDTTILLTLYSFL